MKLGRLARSTAALAAVALLGAAAAGLVATKDALATSATGPCTTGRAVPDAVDNPGLVSDCEALLASRDALRGSARLNWSADTPIADWDGITIGRTPKRVTGLRLNERQLTGEIPAEFGSLDNLQLLYLFGNELGGEIPAELGGLSSLKWLHLHENQLSGEIPSQFGDLSSLEWLNLSENQLSGEIPSSLGSLSNLERLYFQGNQLIGCIPGRLKDVESNDLDQLGLPFCEVPTDCSTGRAVPYPANNPGLVSDCEALLAARDILVGTATPSWSSDSSSRDLGDITVRGLPRDERLDVETPPGLSNVANLEDPRLYDNQLSEEIPPESPPAARHSFGPVTLNWSPDRPIRDWDGVTVGGTPRRVTGLRLSYYRLSGTIPPELGSLSNLERLYLHENRLTGALPQSLTGLTALETFHFLNNAGLCAPVDSGFQAWLRSIPDAIGSSCAPADSPEDRAVLVALYNATNGANWRHRANWLSDRPIREWYNVVNDVDGRVTGLWLDYNGLTGTIPTELGSLSNLERLDLGGNQLTGTIPVELGSLSSLERLDLGSNELTGTIPVELGSPFNLERLDLGGNQLTGSIPPELGRLSGLEWLDLRGNQLTGAISSELGSLSSLEWLYLDDNLLSGVLPQSLTRLTALERFYFLNNAGLCAPVDSEFQTWLRSVPDAIGSSCAPADSAEDRAVLVALYNATDGANWRNSNNWLSDRPIREWRNVVNDADGRVTELWLSYNKLAGTIPAELASLSNLEWLSLGGNQLTGVIPPELANLSNLELLDFGSNRLSGTIPPELTSLSNLERLDFARNRLSGTIPPELASLSNLELLRLGHNELNGMIPPQLGSLSNLRVLGLSNNELTGTIPPQLGSLSNLRILRLSNNQLTGTIPPQLGALSNLGTLNLSNNQLSGTIPPQLGKLPNLWFLDLDGNQLSGCIPAGLRDVRYFYFYGLRLPYCDVVLSNLTVSPRSLTPPFDPYHTSYTALEGPSRVTVTAASDHDATIEFLDLVGGAIADADSSQEGHQVDLSGDLAAIRVSVTSQDGEATRVYTIRMLPPCATAVPDASNNPGLVSDCEALLAAQDTLAGSARRYWLADILITDWRGVSMGGTPRRVTGLHLSGSWLDGSIPRELGDLSNLIVLSLGNNQLTGEIPPELGSLSNLRTLRLHDNRLTGTIPPELGGLSSLSWLSISGNQLTGCIPEALREVESNDLADLGLPFCDAPSACPVGRAAPDAAGNPGLVSDCKVLLASRDTLIGTATLNWSADRPMTEWDGVTVGRTPVRVTRLYLHGRGLDGDDTGGSERPDGPWSDCTSTRTT